MRRYVSRFGTPRAYVPRSARNGARVEAVEPRILLTTFTVTTAADAGPGSLREAIVAANANAGADLIAFSIGTGPQTIRPATDLPAVDDATTIDGRTQPGWQGTPVVRLDGPAAGMDSVGLHLRGERAQVLDLSVTGFGTGLRLRGDHQAVAGCYVGLDPAGAPGANTYGIELSASFATIGSAADANGGTIADGNVISGNSNVVGFGFGLWVLGHNNTIVGNRIGTNPAGTVKVPNGTGIVVWGGSNHIGTPEAATAGSRNVISGNRRWFRPPRRRDQGIRSLKTSSPPRRDGSDAPAGARSFWFVPPAGPASPPAIRVDPPGCFRYTVTLPGGGDFVPSRPPGPTDTVLKRKT